MRKIFEEKTKPLPISKEMVWKAYKKVKSNKGGVGVDKVSISQYEENLSGNLYKLWNRMASGSYFPPAVREQEIKKDNGKMRKLGIPTVSDRIAQQVIKELIEPRLEQEFHESSYGYRPSRSAHQALNCVKENVRKFAWVIDLDITAFFDNVEHGKLMKALDRHVPERWVQMYVKRWLEAPVLRLNGNIEGRAGKGTPQGGVISPLLANLFMHYAFDSFMADKYPKAWWERYADDGVVHCKTYQQAVYMQSVLRERFRLFGLELNEAKTRIIYCKDEDRKGTYPETSFDFLGYTFRPRLAKNKYGKIFVSFLPAMSGKAVKSLKEEVRGWKLQLKVSKSLNDIAGMFNSHIQGWISYYGNFYRSELVYFLRYINQCLVKWVRRKYKRLKHRRRAEYWLGKIARRDKNLFAHWRYGVLPTAG